MISHSVEISIAGGVGDMVHVLSLDPFFFFFSFCDPRFIVLMYKKPHAVLAMKRTKRIKT